MKCIVVIQDIMTPVKLKTGFLHRKYNVIDNGTLIKYMLTVIFIALKLKKSTFQAKNITVIAIQASTDIRYTILNSETKK